MSDSGALATTTDLPPYPLNVVHSPSFRNSTLVHVDGYGCGGNLHKKQNGGAVIATDKPNDVSFTEGAQGGGQHFCLLKFYVASRFRCSRNTYLLSHL